MLCSQNVKPLRARPLRDMPRWLAYIVDHCSKQAICVFRFGIQQVGKGLDDFPPAPAHGGRKIDQVVEISDNRSLTIAKSVGMVMGNTRCRNHGWPEPKMASMFRPPTYADGRVVGDGANQGAGWVLTAPQFAFAFLM